MSHVIALLNVIEDAFGSIQTVFIIFTAVSTLQTVGLAMLVMVCC